MITYESRAAAYNEAHELLKARPQKIAGWFICKRKGSFVLWPMVGNPPASYKIVDEVYA